MWGWSKNVPEPFSQSSIEVSNSWIRLRCWIITQQFPLIFNRRAGTSNHCAAAKIEITILLWKTIPFHLIYTANNLSLSTFVSYLTRVLSTEGRPCGCFCFFLLTNLNFVSIDSHTSYCSICGRDPKVVTVGVFVLLGAGVLRASWLEERWHLTKSRGGWRREVRKWEEWE